MCVVDMDDRRSHSGYSLRIITNLNFKVNQFRYLLNRTGVVLVIVRSLMPRGLPISWGSIQPIVTYDTREDVCNDS